MPVETQRTRFTSAAIVLSGCMLLASCGGEAEPPAARRAPASRARPEPEAPMAFVLDGAIGEREWPPSTVRSVQTVATSWGPGQNELRRIFVARDEAHLYLAIEGALEPRNAWVVYLDVDPAVQIGVAAPRALRDDTGPLDAALSHSHLDDPPSFWPSAAWGTLTLEHTADEWDPRTGWRLLSNADDLAWISGTEHPTVCGSDACETRIALSALEAGPSTPIRLYARLVSADGEHTSNQGLPPIGADPALVREVIELGP